MKLTLRSENADRDLLLISVFTFFTVTLWIFFEVLKTAKTTTVSPTTAQIVTPLSPNVDMNTIQTLEAKKAY
ncbi:MAG: hypothetical protein UY49_C0027G0003 [Microgenomates group bacterium GW2011_GWC1_49_7]|nr:MAG: hypothetical protein UY49_C0027G0003 [Microgenomates group bacterium GW2011_GWC1_49_7]